MSWDAGAITGSLQLNISEFAHGMVESEALMQAFPPIVVEFLENPLLALIGITKEVTEAIGDMVSEVLLAADDMGLLAQKTGMSVEFLSQMSWAAKDVNIPSNSLALAYA